MHSAEQRCVFLFCGHCFNNSGVLKHSIVHCGCSRILKNATGERGDERGCRSRPAGHTQTAGVVFLD